MSLSELCRAHLVKAVATLAKLSTRSWPSVLHGIAALGWGVLPHAVCLLSGDGAVLCGVVSSGFEHRTAVLALRPF